MDMVNTFVLGLVQGLTEFIPVSSSGHLVIFQTLFGETDHLFIDFINLGTLAALLVYYRLDLLSIWRDVTKNRNYRLARNIIITSIPAGLVGLMLAHIIDTQPFFTDITVVLIAMAVVGVVMVASDRLPHASLVENGSMLSWRRALVVGLAQMLALIPGVSRSGSTIVIGRMCGLSASAAADYSFLASIPIMLAVTVKMFVGASDRAYMASHLPQIVVGNIVAFVVGLLAIGFLIKYLRGHGLKLFGYYRIALGIVVLAIVALQAV